MNLIERDLCILELSVEKYYFELEELIKLSALFKFIVSLDLDLDTLENAEGLIYILNKCKNSADLQ